MVVSVCLPCTSGARTRRKAHPPPPARLARRRHRAAAPRTTPESACLPAEVLQLLTFSFLQSNSNFIVSLSNLCKRCEGATVPAAEPHFANLPAALPNPACHAPRSPMCALAVPPHPPSHREILKLLTFSFFAKQFKLYRQLTERK